MRIGLDATSGDKSDRCATCGHARALHRQSGCTPNGVGGHKCVCTRFRSKDEPENVVPIGSAKQLAVDDRYLTSFGKSTFRKFSFGSVGTIANAKVQVIDTSGRAVEMTEDEAREAGGAFMTAAYVAKVWREKITGFNAVRVTRFENGAVHVACHGKTHAMRPLKARPGSRAHSCQNCNNNEAPVYYVLVDRGPKWNRHSFVEVCAECVDRLAQAPTGLRVIEPSADVASGEESLR